MPSRRPPGAAPEEARTAFRWLMASDVCKHCTHAGCLDVCPTGALFRTEFGTVVVQQDICNGCGYCVSGCPYGVIDRREGDGRAWKCTLCYDRLHDGLEPACAKACPTESIQFGPLDELRERAAQRVEELHERGVTEARLYGHDPNDGVGGDGAFFLLLDEPEVYGLPPDPVVPTRDRRPCGGTPGMAASAPGRRRGAAAFAGAVADERLGRTTRPDGPGPAPARGRPPAVADAQRRRGDEAAWRRGAGASSGRTTAAPCSRRRCGSGRSPPTCSPAACPRARRCWPRAPT